MRCPFTGECGDVSAGTEEDCHKTDDCRRYQDWRYMRARNREIAENHDTPRQDRTADWRSENGCG